MALDIVRLRDKHKAGLHELYLDIKKWKKFKTRYSMKWNKVKFNEANRKQVPQEPGVYAFILSLEDYKLPEHGYILYFGITGDDTSQSNLRIRYGRYIRELKTEKGRPRVLYMLKRWNGSLYFHYVSFAGKNVNLKKIETDFISSLIPPVNIMDFEAEVMAARRATF